MRSGPNHAIHIAVRGAGLVSSVPLSSGQARSGQAWSGDFRSGDVGQVWPGPDITLYITIQNDRGRQSGECHGSQE